jgi:hypothetical protein
MKTEIILTEEQLIHQAIDLLTEKIGLLETIRFLSLKSQNRIDSIERHQQWQAGLDKDVFFDNVFGKPT